MSVNYKPFDEVNSVLSVDYYPSGRVISIKSELCIPSAENDLNDYPAVASAPADGTQFAANFDLSKKTD